jgi:hypothetical protein
MGTVALQNISINRMGGGDIGNCGGEGSVTPVGGGEEKSVALSCCRFCTGSEVSPAGIICIYLV